MSGTGDLSTSGLCDAAITMLGGVTGDKRVDYDGNRNVVEVGAFAPDAREVTSLLTVN